MEEFEIKIDGKYMKITGGPDTLFTAIKSHFDNGREVLVKRKGVWVKV